MAEYARIKYGKQKGIYGSVVKTAPTGSAAKLLEGFTWQAVYGKSKVKRKSSNQGYMSKNTAKAVGAKISGLKLLVIDEISMINLETLAEISSRQIVMVYGIKVMTLLNMLNNIIRCVKRLFLY